MQVNRSIDSDMQLESGDGYPKDIDHGASAVENLKEAGKGLLRAILPDAAFRFATEGYAEQADDMRPLGKGGSVDQMSAVFMGTAGLLVGLFVDGAEAVYKPVLAAKDIVDAAVHGIIAGFKGIF